MSYFLPFDPPNNPKNQNLKKMEKNTRRYYHFTFVYNKWWSYDRWFLRFSTIFCPFTPPTTQKIKILKKKCLKISSIYTSVPKIMTICYSAPEIWHVTDVILFFILDYLLPFCPKNQNFKKNEKKPGDIILHTCTKNYHQMMYGFWDMVCYRWRDRQMDKKSDV